MTTYPEWLIELVRDYGPRVIPLDVTPEGTYEESTTRWGPNPVYEAVPSDLRAIAEERRATDPRPGATRHHRGDNG